MAQAGGPELEERGLSIDERAREVIEYLAKRLVFSRNSYCKIISAKAVITLTILSGKEPSW